MHVPQLNCVQRATYRLPRVLYHTRHGKRTKIANVNFTFLYVLIILINSRGVVIHTLYSRDARALSRQWAACRSECEIEEKRDE